jgi:hypothetical protein
MSKREVSENVTRVFVCLLVTAVCKIFVAPRQLYRKVAARTPIKKKLIKTLFKFNRLVLLNVICEAILSS